MAHSMRSLTTVKQPLNAAIHTGLNNLFASTPIAILQPRTAVAWQFAPNSVLRIGLFSDILPGSVADAIGLTKRSVRVLPEASSPAHRRRRALRLVFSQSRLRPCPTANCIPRILWSGVWGSSISLEARSAFVRSTSALEL